jgi:hypothetical protein
VPTTSSRATRCTWGFIDQLYKRNLPLSRFLELAKGTIGEGHANTFIGFVKNLADMPDMKEIWDKPKTAPIPKSPALLHTVITTLIDRMTHKDMDRCMDYVNRLNKDIQTVFVTTALHKDIRVTETKSYVAWGVENEDFLTA